MFKKFYALAATCAAIVIAPHASATTINFDNLNNGAVVTNQYAGVAFSSIAGSQILTTAQNLGSTLPNFICTGIGTSINCTDPVFVNFTTAVSGLSFVAVGDNSTGINGAVKLFGGNALLGTVNIIGDGNALTPYLVNLGAFNGITRIEITTTDVPGGLGYDDFTFTVGGVAGAVPEPASWAMMIAGFGLVGGAMRRRSHKAVFATA